MMTAQPIFIHSLWRSGSTYIFNVFRRSQGGYWCYQEPLHETALLAKDNPSSLLQHPRETIKLLRHPPIDTPYFHELYEVASESLAHLTKHAIYDAYFETESEDGQNGISYFRALIEAAKGIPVIQECRTSARISLIKNKLGGVHIYLWRNPWDQWWSYKVADYFDVVNQLIINSQTHPHEIAYLRKEIDFREFHDDNIMHEFEWFSKLRLSPEHSYLVFYTLWCLALKSGIQNADVILNIDRLSDSLEYRSQFKQHLTELSVTGLDFSDCHVPQAIYNETDTAFFLPIEDKVYGILLLNGWSITEVDKIKTLRLEYEPLCRKTAASPTTETLSVQIEQAARARALAKRFEGQLSEAYKCIRRA
ncbi:MAG: hypothetical protein ACUVQ6_08865, partial [Dissulfurimicrobium sp.]|uniref:hypothetical protein n=1 Tax=Dissulfurimicrobium sp. TaxID=2022436 RepID=UPI0040494CDC